MWLQDIGMELYITIQVRGHNRNKYKQQNYFEGFFRVYGSRRNTF